jgi:hypothetical protein
MDRRPIVAETIELGGLSSGSQTHPAATSTALFVSSHASQGAPFPAVELQYCCIA